MYGKFFASTFTGSMHGAGAHVFAVWSYAIANADAKGYVEINAAMLAAIIGEPKEKIVDALKKLIGPDADSRSKAEGGARMVREGQFIYRIVNHKVYRAIRDEDDRRLRQRETARSKRSESLDLISRDLPASAQVEEEVEEEVEKKRSDSAEPGGPAPAPFMVFPCSGRPRKWNLSQIQMDRFQELFPALDVPATMRDALAWQEAAGPKRKTARGMMRFLTGWLTRNQDSGRGPRRPGGGGGGGTDLERAALRLSGRKDPSE